MNPNELRLKELTEEILFYTKYEKANKTSIPQLKELIKERDELLSFLNR